MLPERYPSPSASAQNSGPFFGSNNNSEPSPQTLNEARHPQPQEFDVEQLREIARPSLQPISHIPNDHDHDYNTEHVQQIDDSLHDDNTLRGPSSAERVAQSVMDMSHRGASPYTQGHEGGNIPGSASTKTRKPRTKVSRACDECRRKKIRCDAPEAAELIPEACTNCKRTGVDCRFSRQPMKRGPSKGYIKELADRLINLENQFGSPQGGAHAQQEPQHDPGSDTFEGQGLGMAAELISRSLRNTDELGPLPPDSQNTQTTQDVRKRTHSMTEREWATENDFASGRTQVNDWTTSTHSRQTGHHKIGDAVSDTAGLDVWPSRGTGGSGGQQSDSASNTNMNINWDEAVVDDYYRLIHPTFPVLSPSKSHLRTRLAFCPAALREAFLVSLYCAVRSSAVTDLEPGADMRRRAAELITAWQYEQSTTRTLLAHLIYIQTLVLMALESDNHGPATLRDQIGPPRSEWLARAIGTAIHLKLNVPRYRAGDEGLDTDETLGRRVWWVLFILDRWHAASTASMLQIPETSSSLLPEDQALLGESAFQLARLSYILGHLCAILQQPASLMDPHSPAAPIISTTILGEIERFRESVNTLLSGPPSLVQLCYLQVRLLILRLTSATAPHDLLIPATSMANILRDRGGRATWLDHHFWTLAALTLLELQQFVETKSGASAGLDVLFTAAMNSDDKCEGGVPKMMWKDVVLHLMNGSRDGFDFARDVRDGHVAVDEERTGEVEVEVVTLQHLADVAVAGKKEHFDGVDDGVGVEGMGMSKADAFRSAYDPTLLSRYGYLAALAHQKVVGREV